MPPEPAIRLLAAGEDDCGEGCGRAAEIEVSGLTFCAACLDEMVTLGGLLARTIEEATQQRQRIAGEYEADG